MYCLEVPPMTTRQVQIRVYKKKKFFDWKTFSLIEVLDLFQQDVSGILTTQPNGKSISVKIGALVFNYDVNTDSFISTRGDKIAKLHFETISHLRLL